MFTISTTVYEVIWETLRLPAMPVRITIDQHGDTAAERERIRAAALAQAERLGLGRAPNLDAGLAALLALLADHDQAVDLRELNGRRRSAIAVASGRRGAMAAIEGEQIAIAPISGDHLVTEMLQLLPARRQGAGRTCSVRSGVLKHAMKALAVSTDSHRARTILRDNGVRDGDVEQLLHTARTGTESGSIGVYRRQPDRPGLPNPIGSLAYTDTPQGRYLVLRRADRAGDSYTTVIPTDLTGLRRRIQELLSAAG